MDIDTTTEFGQRAASHLANDHVVWLTTVNPDQTPQPSPVWFFWDGDTLLIYSQPGTPKLRNIGQRPRVSASFNSTPSGGDIVILTGEAKEDAAAPTVANNAEYLAKYARGIEEIGMTPESFSQAYSVPVRVRPTSLRGH